MAASSKTAEELVDLQSGRYLTFTDVLVSGTTTNAATGSAGTSGADVGDLQLGKLTVLPHSCSIDFNVQLEFDTESEFYRIDQSERTAITYPWTQEVNLSGVSRIYVAVTAFTASGDNHRVDIKIGKAGAAP